MLSAQVTGAGASPAIVDSIVLRSAAASHGAAERNRDSAAVRPPSERATSGEVLIARQDQGLHVDGHDQAAYPRRRQGCQRRWYQGRRAMWLSVLK